VPDTWQPEPEPSTVRLTVDAVGALARNPLAQVRLVANALRTPSVLAGRLTDTTRGLARLAGALMPVTKSSLTGPIGQQRRYGVSRVSLADMVEVAKTYQVTVNDVLLAAVTSAFRATLLRQGEIPSADAVRTLVPVSVRANGDEGIVDNRISLMLPLLPVDIADPIGRLREVHTRLAALKASKEAEAGAAMTTLARHEPFAPISLGIRMAAHLPHRNIVTVTTNVPGPRRPLYALGRRIIEILPYVPIAVRLRTGISALTYDGQMCFGVTSDYDTGPEADLLAGQIADGVAELVNGIRNPAGRARKAPTKRTAAKRRRVATP
jgi:diacylglycerol O-acyltransferase